MNLETIKSELEAGVPGCQLEIVANASPSGQHSLLIDADTHSPENCLLISIFYLSSVSGTNF